VVVDDGYQLLLGDLRTGKIQASIPYRDLKWGLRVNAPGPISATIRPFSKQLRNHDLRSLTATVKQFMAIGYGEEILEAGPIWTRPFDEDTAEMTLNGLGLWSIFDRRKNVNGAMLLPGARVTEDVIKVADVHLGSVARELVRISIQDNPYGGDLPVVLPDVVADPGNPGRTYNGYNLTWLGDDLRELTKAEGGPDLRFRPRRKPGNPTFIEWVLEHGAIDVLTQDGPDHQWDARPARSGIAKLGVSQDGQRMGAKAWVTGSGQEQQLRLASKVDTTLVDAGYPWLEVEASAGDEEDLTVLQSMANRGAQDARYPWDAWSLTVRADTRPRLGTYQAGDWALVNTPENHPVLPAGGKVRVRILAVDGSAGNEVTLAVAPIQGVQGSATAAVTIADPNATPVVLPLIPGDSLAPAPSLILTS